MIPNGFEKLEGKWKGSNTLHTSWIPEDPIKESESTAEISTAAMGQALKVEYTWEYQGKPQTGLMIITAPKDSEDVNFYWLDSWHLSHSFLNCSGTFDGKMISVTGSYKVGDHPEWYWRTELKAADGFSFTMYNISPEGEEHLAVESSFERS